MIDDQMPRGSHQVMLHFYRSSPILSANGVESVPRSLCVPSVLDQTRVVLCIYNSELTLCKRDQALGACIACDSVCGIFNPLTKAHNIRRLIIG